LLLASEGACVVAADVTGTEQETASSNGEGALAVHADVSKAADVAQRVATASLRDARGAV